MYDNFKSFHLSTLLMHNFHKTREQLWIIQVRAHIKNQVYVNLCMATLLQVVYWKIKCTVN